MKNIPVMLCCNDDQGQFAGELYAIEFGDDSETLTLECNFSDWWPKMRYVLVPNSSVALQFLASGEDWETGSIWQCNFVPGSWCDHVGNWCWDRVLLAPDTALVLLNWLKRQKENETPWFSLDVAEETLWKVWESDSVDFTKSDLRIITGESVNNRLVPSPLESR